MENPIIQGRDAASMKFTRCQLEWLVNFIEQLDILQYIHDDLNGNHYYTLVKCIAENQCSINQKIQDIIDTTPTIHHLNLTFLRDIIDDKHKAEFDVFTKVRRLIDILTKIVTVDDESIPTEITTNLAKIIFEKKDKVCVVCHDEIVNCKDAIFYGCGHYIHHSHYLHVNRGVGRATIRKCPYRCGVNGMFIVKS